MLLLHNNDGKQRELSPATDRKAITIARAVFKAQVKAAEWLNRTFGALPFRSKMLCLLLFCLLLGGASGWILAEAILPDTQAGAPTDLQRIVPDSLAHPNPPYFTKSLK
jgi:hypothetical protein